MPTGAMQASDRSPSSSARFGGPAPALRLDGVPEADPLAPILERAAAGDPEAWRQIVDLYSRRVYALARSRLGRGGRNSARTVGRDGGLGTGDDAAEEVTQSVFVTVASKLASGGYTERGRFESWLFRIAMNRVRDEARRRKRQADPTDPATLAGLGASERDRAERRGETEDRNRLFGCLREAMEELSESDREVIELRHHGGMSFKAMADMLSEPVGTLLARHHRALRKLKELLPASVRAAYESAEQSEMQGADQ